MCAFAVCLASVIGLTSRKTVKARPNFLFITIDTLRRDHLGFYGSTVSTPNLDALAADSIVFENYFSSANCTTPAHLSLFSGRYPRSYSIFDNEKYDVSKLRFIPSFLKKVGYRSVGIAAVPFLGKQWLHGFGDQFDRFSSPAENNLRASDISEQFSKTIPFLKSSRNFFCWLHYYDPHSPYEPPKRFQKMYDAWNPSGPLLPEFDPAYAPTQWLKPSGIHRRSVAAALYKGEVSYTDQEIGNVLRLMKDSKLDQNTVIVVVADHGEMLGERGVYFGHQTLYNQTIRVPFLIHAPGFRPHRTASIVSAVDVAPTILNLAGAQLAAYFEGLPLGKVLAGMELPETRMAFSFHAEKIAVALMRWPYKYVHNMAAYGDPEKYELFDLARDPLEKHNQMESNNFVFRLMDDLAKDELEKQQAGLPAFPLTRKEKEKMAALGYAQ